MFLRARKRILRACRCRVGVVPRIQTRHHQILPLSGVEGFHFQTVLWTAHPKSEARPSMTSRKEMSAAAFWRMEPPATPEVERMMLAFVRRVSILERYVGETWNWLARASRATARRTSPGTEHARSQADERLRREPCPGKGECFDTRGGSASVGRRPGDPPVGIGPGWILLAAGGLSYTVGTIFFVLGNRWGWFHPVWHLFVLGGTLCHFFAVLAALSPSAGLE